MSRIRLPPEPKQARATNIPRAIQLGDAPAVMQKIELKSNVVLKAVFLVQGFKHVEAIHSEVSHLPIRSAPVC